jgi:uncharacterized membrane protein YkvA (DUF1232 family)
MTPSIQRWKAWANRLKIEIYALYLAYRDPRTPWYAKVVAAFVVGYAFSPIDLIPDFIPVLGLLDDIVLVPLGLALVIRLTPAAHWQARLREAERGGEALPRMLWGAVLVIAVWLLVAALFAGWLIWLMKGAWR